MTSFFSLSQDTSVSLGSFWFENNTNCVFKKIYSLTRICCVCNRLDFQLGFSHGKPTSPKGFFPLWSMNTIYDITYIVFVLSLPSSKEEVWLQAQHEAGLVFAQGDFSRAVIHWHEIYHPLVCWKTSTGLPPCCTGSGSALLHIISWTITSLLLCLQTVRFLEGAGGNKPHYIAVCIGTALLSRERDLGRGPAWLPVGAVKCFPVWEHRSHLSRQVHRLKWLPVWKCSHLSTSLLVSLFFCSYFLLLSTLSLSTSWWMLSTHTT